MKLSFYTFIFAVMLTPINTYNSDTQDSTQMENFNLRMPILLPFLTGLHTFSAPNQKLHITFHLSTSNEVTKNALLKHLFSEEKKRNFYNYIKAQNPCILDNQIALLFKNRQQKTFEQATDPLNFASIENHVKKALSFSFINEQTVLVALALSDTKKPFTRSIQLFNTHEFSPEPPVVTFNPEQKTITQTFKIRHKNTPRKPLHIASWLYMKKTPIQERVQEKQLNKSI